MSKRVPITTNATITITKIFKANGETDADRIANGLVVIIEIISA